MKLEFVKVVYLILVLVSLVVITVLARFMVTTVVVYIAQLVFRSAKKSC